MRKRRPDFHHLSLNLSLNLPRTLADFFSILLKVVHGVVTGLAGQDQEAGRTRIEQAARSAGIGMAADVNPSLMAKLPLPFKQMGMSIHEDMDALADAIVQKETPQQILQRLSSMTARCTTCHDVYRFSTER